MVKQKTKTFNCMNQKRIDWNHVLRSTCLIKNILYSSWRTKSRSENIHYCLTFLSPGLYLLCKSNDRNAPSWILILLIAQPFKGKYCKIKIERSQYLPEQRFFDINWSLLQKANFVKTLSKQSLSVPLEAITQKNMDRQNSLRIFTSLTPRILRVWDSELQTQIKAHWKIDVDVAPIREDIKTARRVSQSRWTWAGDPFFGVWHAFNAFKIKIGDVPYQGHFSPTTAFR